MLEGGGQSQGLAAQCAEVGCLDGADVALRGDGVVGEGIALWRSDYKMTHEIHFLWHQQYGQEIGSVAIQGRN